MKKPDCFKCKHVGSVPGGCHSKCNHPEVKGIDDVLDNPVGELLGILAGAGRIQSVILPPPEFTLKANQRGIDGGWFNWPFNFDPVWLEECSGFEKAGEE